MKTIIGILLALVAIVGLGGLVSAAPAYEHGDWLQGASNFQSTSNGMGVNYKILADSDAVEVNGMGYAAADMSAMSKMIFADNDGIKFVYFDQGVTYTRDGKVIEGVLDLHNFPTIQRAFKAMF